MGGKGLLHEEEVWIILVLPEVWALGKRATWCKEHTDTQLRLRGRVYEQGVQESPWSHWNSTSFDHLWLIPIQQNGRAWQLLTSWRCSSNAYQSRVTTISMGWGCITQSMVKEQDSPQYVRGQYHPTQEDNSLEAWPLSVAQIQVHCLDKEAWAKQTSTLGRCQRLCQLWQRIQGHSGILAWTKKSQYWKRCLFQQRGDSWAWRHQDWEGDSNKPQSRHYQLKPKA